MRVIEATIEVDDRGMATFHLPPGVKPGSHRVVVVIDEAERVATPLTFSNHDVGPWPGGFTVRREDLP